MTLADREKTFWACCGRSRNRHWQLPALRTLKRGCSKLGDSLRIFWPAWHSFIKTCWHLVNNFVTVGKSLSRAANTVSKLFDVLFLQEQLVASFALLGHSCKTGNVRYGGTSKTLNWNYQTFDNFVLKFFHTYVIQLDINYGPPLSTFFSPIMEEYNILDVPP